MWILQLLLNLVRKSQNVCSAESKTLPMKKIKILLFPIVFLLAGACEVETSEVTTFILVRHAEKGNDGTDDPDLTTEGEARASRLAFMLRDTPLQAIYSTNFRRTKNTAKPVAEVRNLDVQLYEAHKPDVIAKMVREHKGGIVLIAGHSDDIPWTANLLLGRHIFDDYAESQYGTVLIVSVGKTNDGTTVTRVNY
jgi:phosphohistidine phosphatase SixA